MMRAIKQLLGTLFPRRERVYLAQTRDGRIVQIPERRARQAGLLD